MSFVPQNALEASLMKAAADPAHRPQFYRDLLEADVFIIQPPLPEGDPADGRMVLSRGESIQIGTIESDGRQYLPVFSSLPLLQAMLTEPASYLRMGMRSFLEMTRGADIVLNPGAEYGKEIVADEAAALLDGTIWQPSEQFVAEKETEVLIGQPANYPDELVKALTRLFRGRKQVQRAWLAHFYNPQIHERAHTLVCVELSGDRDRIFADAGIVAGEVPVPDPPVDFIRYADDGGLGEYFKNTRPFYVRRRFRFF
jgi:SseB protein C-terminal domain/SseB protein N-terminal domain